MPASNPGTRQANDMDPPGKSWTWGIILPVVYCSAQSAAAAFWRMKYYSVLHNHCGHGHIIWTLIHFARATYYDHAHSDYVPTVHQQLFEE